MKSIFLLLFLIYFQIKNSIETSLEWPTSKELPPKESTSNMSATNRLTFAFKKLFNKKIGSSGNSSIISPKTKKSPNQKTELKRKYKKCWPIIN